MHMRHNRMVTINKEQLIAKIIENKAAHIVEFEEAKKAYVVEAHRLLEGAKKRVDEGKMDIMVRLTTPVNRSEEYDKVVEMFKWEVKDEVELTQSEFNEYVHDDNDSARSAKLANSSYSTQF